LDSAELLLESMAPPGAVSAGLKVLHLDLAYCNQPLGDVMEQGGYAPIFAERYLYPMASAVWSMSSEAIGRFPALTLLRFFANHGMLGINTHPKWKVVRGGSDRYIPPLTAPYKERIYKGVDIQSVSRGQAGVTQRFRDRPPMGFDQVVFSCYGDQILPLLKRPATASGISCRDLTPAAMKSACIPIPDCCPSGPRHGLPGITA
jgi:predicted NAD/FAD-binding protein